MSNVREEVSWFRSENDRVHYKVHKDTGCSSEKIMASQTVILGRFCQAQAPSVSYLHPFQLPEYNPITRLGTPRPSISCDPTSIRRFYEDYVIFPDGNPEPGWLSFLPKLYLKAGDDSALRFAVKAVADAHAGNKSSDAKLTLAAQENYGISIRMVKEDLADLNSAVKNDTVAAVFLLGMYEIRPMIAIIFRNYSPKL